MKTEMKLSQVLNGDWVITVANPEEEGWEMQIASFEANLTVEGSKARHLLERAAILSLITLSDNDRYEVKITSHKSYEKQKMTSLYNMLKD